MTKLSAFKAYDIRGKVPDELNVDLAYKLGRVFVDQLQAKRVVLGYDIRLESEGLAAALTSGLTEAGAEVLSLGLCGTEEVYFNTVDLNADGGIMVTASHNPKGYNGMKLVSKGAQPISRDSGLTRFAERILADDLGEAAAQPGLVTPFLSKGRYIKHLMSYVDLASLKPLKVVMDCGNGAAGAVIRDIAAHLPFECVFVNDTPDGNFPNGVPNPLLPTMREITASAVREHQADLGIAWDGDFDRCFLFDETGEFVEGYYLVGLLAKTLLAKQPGAKIIYDPRLTWNTIEQVIQAGGIPIQSKTGHAFIKERMRLEDALYGGEMSAHHYFKDFFYCDSGMIPWLLITQLMSVTVQPLSALVAERVAAYPCSGELNYKVADVAAVLARVEAYFAALNPQQDDTDGLGLDFGHWRLNIRASNTEPLLRLNVESKGNEALVWQKVAELEKLIRSLEI
ncbi:phosphomannomutase [Thiomicrospira aerophila AL3]|uniref:phosphomannomutase n=1 Tax=Thiomicrospira aerophila AL3 TaxID=717772 RepID=W0DRX4_9GAMM|nr:phosphomannomutase/phosphoglucomutase [Thiomicrospira aerophila]AHF01385.1 phosphomannomutase [Thiomicrospira aerophila AL3]